MDDGYNPYNPIMGQKFILNKLADKDIDIVEPTNPFVMLLEANAVTTAAALDEMVRNDRQIYPYLAVTDEDIYRHMTTDEEIHMFASPSEAKFRLYVQYNDILNNGINIKNGKTITIPGDTIIDLSGVDFRLPYDVHIQIRDGSPYVYQDVYSHKDSLLLPDSILASAIVSLTDNVEWVVFDINTTQVSLTTTDIQIIRNIKTTKKVTLPEGDQYFRSVCYIDTPTGRRYLDVTHADTVIDHNNPTVTCRVSDNVIHYNVPAYYIETGMIRSVVYIKTYSTKGKVFFNIPDNDSSITIDTSGCNVDTLGKSVGVKTNIIPRLQHVVDGGVDFRSFDTRRDKVIKNTTGTNMLPVTYNQIFEAGDTMGFNLSLVKDTITERLFVASKNNVSKPYGNDVEPVIEFNNCTIDPIILKDFIKRTDDLIVIPEGLTFRLSGGVMPLMQDEIDTVSKLETKDRIAYYNTNKIYKSLHTIVIYTSPTDIGCDIYDMSTFNIGDTSISDINIPSNRYVTTNNVTMTKTNDMYNVYLTLLKDTKAGYSMDNVKVMLMIPIVDSDNHIYIKGTVDDNDIYKFDLQSDGIPYNDTIRIKGVSLAGKPIEESILLKNRIGVITYGDNNIGGDDLLTINLYPLLNSNDIIISTEFVDATFGVSLKDIHTNIKTIFTDRKYKLYEDDVIDVYEQNVYDRTTNGTIRLDNGMVKMLHKAGDIKYEYARDSSGNIILNGDGTPTYEYIKDEKGVELKETVVIHGEVITVSIKKPIIKHKKGDIVYDEQHNPIVDYIDGREYVLNMAMMDYLFYSTPKYNKNNIKLARDLLVKWITIDMPKLNKMTLEHTKIELNPITNNKLVVLHNNIRLNNIIRPKVKIHVANDVDISSTTGELSRLVGTIFNKHINKLNFTLQDIRNDIIDSIAGNVHGVSIDMMDNASLEKYSIKPTSNRFTIDYMLDRYGEIVYDIDVTVDIG